METQHRSDRFFGSGFACAPRNRDYGRLPGGKDRLGVSAQSLPGVVNGKNCYPGAPASGDQRISAGRMLTHPYMLDDKRAGASFDGIGRKVVAIAMDTAHRNKAFTGQSRAG